MMQLCFYKIPHTYRHVVFEVQTKSCGEVAVFILYYGVGTSPMFLCKPNAYGRMKEL